MRDYMMCEPSVLCANREWRTYRHLTRRSLLWGMLSLIGLIICLTFLPADLNIGLVSVRGASDHQDLYFGSSTRKKQWIILDENTFSVNKFLEYKVDNCLVVRPGHRLAANADIVAITAFKVKSAAELWRPRPAGQIWVWVEDESPYHHGNVTSRDFRGLFNWTMSYRMDSDVYIPYGHTYRRTESFPIPEFIATKQQPIAAMISNCKHKNVIPNCRIEYIEQLNKVVPVVIYGGCGRQCGGYRKDQQTEICHELKEYLFYLAFENSNCREYITEKVFANAFTSGAVPVVMGAKRRDYEKITPPNSFIHVGDFKSPSELGEYLLKLSKNRTAYMEYHSWRHEYYTTWRIQYLNDTIWRPLCRQMNDYVISGSMTSKTVDIEKFWDVSRDCEPDYSNSVNGIPPYMEHL